MISARAKSGRAHAAAGVRRANWAGLSHPGRPEINGLYRVSATFYKWLDGRRAPAHDLLMGIDARRTVHALIAEASARIERLEPAEAHAAQAAGACLVDIRSEVNRAREGIVPGSLHVPRTVFEWRLDPESPWRTPHAPDLDQRVVVLCDHGFSSVLAAATLADLGFTRPADVVGGFEAWRAAGLPTATIEPATAEAGELPGMSPPFAQ
jgi:rhodanese-related sulfurtransferase